MQSRYFKDTDTLAIAFDEFGPVARTEDGPSEDLLMEYDEEGRLIGMTIEHASENVHLDAFTASSEGTLAGWVISQIKRVRRSLGSSRPARQPNRYPA